MTKDPNGSAQGIGTVELFKEIGLNPNGRNTTVMELLERDPFFEVLEQDADVVLATMKRQYEALYRTDVTSAQRGRFLPVSAEFDNDGALLVLWRVTPWFISGGAGYPFRDDNLAFLFYSGNFDEYIRIHLREFGHPEKAPASGLAARSSNLTRLKPIKANTIAKLMQHEISPSSFPGNLISAFDDIVLS